MSSLIQGPLAVVGRLMFVGIFILSAAGNKIPEFSNVVQYMQQAGVPAPQVMLAGAIVFLLVGGLSVLLGWKARWGAALLAIFLVLATYYFHDFWTITDVQARQGEMIQFMKNVSLLGATILIIANGTGPMSLDNRREGTT